MTPLHPDDARSARAWAAFVADDARAAAPPSLEARVMRAAQAAVAQKRRDDAERHRRRWFAGCSAIAASLLAAAAWSLAPPHVATPASNEPAAAPQLGTPAAASSPAIAAAEAAFAGAGTEDPGPPLPMTNVEAGRVLRISPPSMLAARPLFDAADGVGPVAAPARLRAKAFGGPTIEPTFTRGRPTHSIPASDAPALAAAPTLSAPTAPAGASAAPEVWSSRGFNGVFDPEASEQPVPPPIRLDHTAPTSKPQEEPPAPPK